MKLINIYNDSLNQSTSFSGYLDDDLLLSPNSKIDLISADIDISASYIEIPAGATFLFATQTANVPNKMDTVILTEGTYTAPELIKHLTSRMNAALDNTNDNHGALPFTRGFAWNNSVVDNKVLLTFSQYLNSATSSWNYNITAPIALDPDGKTLIRKVTTPNNWNGYAVVTRPMTNGLGEVVFQLKDVGTGTQNFCIGLVSGEMPANAPSQEDLQPNEYTLAITSDGTGDANCKYQVVVNNTITDLAATILPENDDIITFELTLGVIHIYVLKGAGPRVEVYSMDWTDYNTVTNWICASLYGNATQITGIYMYLDPFITSNLVQKPYELPSYYFEYDDEGNWGATPPKIRLDFTGSVVGRILGFSADSYDKQANTGTFNADKTLQFLGATASSILVQLNNIQLQSYNMRTNVANRQNILKVIPFNALSPTDSNLVYLSGYKQAINISNNQPLNLKRLDITLLDAATNEPIPVDAASLAIAVYDENE